MNNPQQWWQSLSDQWRWIFSENLKEKGKKTFFNAELAPQNLTISDADLHRLLHEQHTLVAAYSKINDISPLSALGNCIKNLYLNLNDIHSIDTLATFKQLQILQIGGNAISDITPLAASANSLKECQLNGNRIEQVDVLSNFSQLENLEIADNRIRDITALNGLHQLRVLNLNHNPIDNWGDVGQWHNLRELSIMRIPLSDKQLNDIKNLLPNTTILAT